MYNNMLYSFDLCILSFTYLLYPNLNRKKIFIRNVMIPNNKKEIQRKKEKTKKDYTLYNDYNHIVIFSFCLCSFYNTLSIPKPYKFAILFYTLTQTKRKKKKKMRIKRKIRKMVKRKVTKEMVKLQ